MEANKLTYKYIRATTKEHGHTAILLNGIRIGYFIKNRSKFREVNSNYYLEFRYFGCHYHIHVSNKQKAIDYVNSQVL